MGAPSAHPPSLFEVLIEMKRLGAFFSAVLLASMISGCTDTGIKEGISTEDITPDGNPKGFREMMEKDAAKMQLKGKTGPPEDSKKAAAAGAAEKKAQTP
jgi:hypothetical protein